MLAFSLIIVICLCVMPLMAALNVEIEKTARRRSGKPSDSPETPDNVLPLPGPFKKGQEIRQDRGKAA